MRHLLHLFHRGTFHTTCGLCIERSPRWLALRFPQPKTEDLIFSYGILDIPPIKSQRPATLTYPNIPKPYQRRVR